VTEINNLNDAILSQVRNYTQDVKEKIEAAAKESAQELAKELKQVKIEKTGSYKKGWRVKKKGKVYVVHNATDYQLTHLLEHGHAKIGGGRVDAKIHIAPAEEKAVHAFIDKVEDVIKS
jgi:ribosomal protein S20